MGHPVRLNSASAQLASWQVPVASPPSSADEAAKRVEELIRQQAQQRAEKIKQLESVQPRMALRRVPDSVTPITAWRGWAAHFVDGKLALCALGAEKAWPAKKALEAECLAHSWSPGGQISRPQHPSPQAYCTCGVWALKDRDALLQATKRYGQLNVIGQVSLWGRVIETENGFRAQYAYPKELWLLDNRLEELGYIYGVPVRTA